jgi:uncharacterized membrane protein YhaH (DUF805 family)
MASNADRSSRMGFFWGMIYATVMATAIVLAVMFAKAADADGARIAWLIILFAFTSRPIIKRLHDLNWAGAWFWLIFIPGLNLILILLLHFKRGTRGANRFGPDPLDEGVASMSARDAQGYAYRAPRKERKIYDPLDNEVLTDPVDVTVRTRSGPVGLRVNRWNAGKLKQGGFGAFPSFRNRINRKSARDYWIRPHDRDGRDDYEVVNGLMWYPMLYHGFDNHTEGYDDMHGNWNDRAYGVTGDAVDAPNEPIFEDGMTTEAYEEAYGTDDDYSRQGESIEADGDYNGEGVYDNSSSYDDGGGWDDGGGFD